jgi:hypothetical protein
MASGMFREKRSLFAAALLTHAEEPVGIAVEPA